MLLWVEELDDKQHEMIRLTPDATQVKDRHFNVCTSTDNTGGKCSAMAVQLFPPSGEQ